VGGDNLSLPYPLEVCPEVTTMKHNCRYEDKCPDEDDCRLKFHTLWARDCPKWQEFNQQRKDAEVVAVYQDAGGD